MRSIFTRRKFLQSSVHVCGLGASTLVMAACGAAAAAPTTAAGTGKTFSFEISSGDDVQFDNVKLAAEAGSQITVKLVNTSTDKLFNWVLARPGRMLKVVTNGMAEGEVNGYLLANDEDVIVHTKLIKAGETDQVTFDAPAPGEYQYFCTFPGYYTRLNGLLTIK